MQARHLLGSLTTPHRASFDDRKEHTATQRIQFAEIEATSPDQIPTTEYDDDGWTAMWVDMTGHGRWGPLTCSPMAAYDRDLNGMVRHDGEKARFWQGEDGISLSTPSLALKAMRTLVCVCFTRRGVGNDDANGIN